tara:strand:- start:1877 stop:3190 length:1314 start_codon:yes stop_codon:yes gene_type:complete
MATIIEMPKLSDTMSVGTLVKWHKDEGDSLENGDILAEVETDKATMELENFEDGVLLKIFVSEGSEVPIGSPLAVVGTEDEEIPEISELSASEPKLEKSSDLPPDNVEEAVNESSTDPVYDSVTDTNEPPTHPVVTKEAGRILASPLARKIALEQNIDLSQIKGTGPNGRIIKKDLQSSELSNGGHAEPTKGGILLPVISSNHGTIEDKTIPVSKMRSVIAQRLLESKTSIPHFYLQKEINALPLKLARSRINQRLADRKDGSKVSINDMVLYACADAIKWFPAINSSWHNSEIKIHGNVHLSFGVAVEDGLVTPVIKNAESMNLVSLSTEAKSLIVKARTKKLMPDEMSGSTFTVTNLGMFGIDFFSGIINPPNAAILSIGASIPKPVLDQTGSVVAGETLILGLSCDHRLVDGAIGAGFLKLLAENLENPASLLV